jgi:phenylalanyl-tRNA synthetase beta chain
VAPAADRAAALIAQLAGGRVARGVIDVYPKQLAPKPIRVRVARANALLGTDITAPDMAATLAAMGCQVEASRARLRVTPPTWRPDVQIEENVVEEIARLYGYDNIPETLPTGGRVGGLTVVQRRRRVARALLTGAGLTEAQTLSLLPPSFAERAGLEPPHPWHATLRLSNPLSEDESILRSSLVPGLLLAAARNVAHRALPVRLFELGTVFTSGGEDVHEAEHVAFVLTGPVPPTWHEADRVLDFFDGKGIIEALTLGLGAPDVRVDADGGDGVGHPGRSARITVGDAYAGSLMELHPRIADRLELPRRVVLGELDVRVLFEAIRESAAGEPVRFPALERDVALVVGQDVSAQVVRDTIVEAAGPLLSSIELFDVYRGEQVAPGTVSLAFSLSMRDPERTLTDADADAVMRAVRDAAAAAGWSVRD